MAEKFMSLTSVAALLFHEVDEFFSGEMSVLSSVVLEHMNGLLDGLVGKETI